jgi:TolB protein
MTYLSRITWLMLALMSLFTGVGPTGAQARSPGQIAYLTKIGRADALAVMNADGSNPHIVFSDDTGLFDPSWSPDGQQIALFSSNGWRSGICIITVSTSTKRCLNANQSTGSPVWSPDGKRLLYVVASTYPDTDFYVMRPDGTGVRRITNSGGRRSRPAWSPDGQQIVYAADTAQYAELFVIRADGSGKRQLTTSGEGCDGCLSKDDPVWSPDGKWIVFTWVKRGVESGPLGSSLYLMNADGSNIHGLTPPNVGAYHATWSPDSTHIAFIANEPSTDGLSGTLSIATLAIDGSNLHSLIHTTEYLASPTWSTGAGN